MDQGLNSNKSYDRVSLFLFIIIVFTAFLTFPDYAPCWDQFFHVEYGKAIINWYTSLFSENRAITGEGIAYNIMYYGGIFDVIGTTFSKIFPFIDDYTARRVIILLTGLSGIFFCWRIGRLLYGPKLGLFCLISIVTIPMYYGHMFFNPKDIPFAAAYICSLYLIIKILMELPSIRIRNIILLACSTGFAVGIRISGLVILAYFAVALILYKVLSKKLTNSRNDKKISISKIAGLIAFVSAISLIIAMLFWPYLLINPLRLFDVSNYATNFNGMKNKYVFSYIWNRFNFQLPEVHVVLFYLGLLLIIEKAYLIYKKKGSIPMDAFLRGLSISLMIVSVAFPLAVIIIKSTPLYNELRQVLFIIPPLSCLLAVTLYTLASEDRYVKYIIAAFFSFALVKTLQLIPVNTVLSFLVILLLAFFFYRILKGVNTKNIKWIIFIVASFSLCQSIFYTVYLHPYEYAYYNRFIGGLRGAINNGYDADYWLINYKETLGKFKIYMDKHPEIKTARIGTCTMPINIKPYLGKKLILEKDPDKMDFFIFTEKAYACHPWDYFRGASLAVETKRSDVLLGGVLDVRKTKNRLLPIGYKKHNENIDMRIRTLSTNDSDLDYNLDVWTVLDKKLTVPNIDFPLSNALYNQGAGFFPIFFHNSFVLEMNTTMLVRQAGSYTINISADNGMRLILDGKTISELEIKKQFHAAANLYETKQIEVFMTKGEHKLNILYTHIPEALIKIVAKYKGSNQEDYLIIGEDSKQVRFITGN